MLKAVIFDLDGTLWDSRKQIVKAWKSILDGKLNIKINEDDLTSLMGKSNEEFKKKFFNNIPDDLANKYLNMCQEEEVIYLRIHGANIYNNSIHAIKELSKNYNLFIVSNCQSGYIESFLSYYNLNQYFKDYECSGTTGLSKEENIKIIIKRNKLLNKNTCYVGDTLSDFMSSNVNNILFIFANYGFGNCKESKYSIKDILDLINLLNSINV